MKISGKRPEKKSGKNVWGKAEGKERRDRERRETKRAEGLGQEGGKDGRKGVLRGKIMNGMKANCKKFVNVLKDGAVNDKINKIV